MRGTLIKGFDYYKALNDPFAKAAYMMFMISEIHPFLDGNGRLGRLLITLLLKSNGILHDPLLYLSLYLKMNRNEYYARLDRVRSHADWEGWLLFFAKAVASVADEAAQTAIRMRDLAEKHRAKIRTVGRKAGSALLVFDALLHRPIVNISEITKFTKLAPNTVAACLQDLARLKIVREVTGKSRNRVFAYDQFMNLMDEGTKAK